ncbi:hypothetical protein B0J11DRAFT_551769 [Dendryphion nanum]|uniref:Cysteine proteinase n=1 Tax=Dendryphion nanum TaxID=256645 RepID=A0A9P9DFG9_9PLEO|nr:hypothetical protein B0J11DRAFT_551769 [Dendryphion nanum]
MNGYSHGASGANGTGAGGWTVNDAGGDGRGPGESTPSVAEISASASEKVNEMRLQPIARLVEQGKMHLANAKARSNGRKGLAATYWEYIVAYELIVDAIPNHHDFHDRINNSRSQLQRDWKDLAKDVQGNYERFMRIKEMIANENKRNGMRSASAQSSRPLSAASQHADSNGSRPSSGASHRRDDELMLPETPSHAPGGRLPTSRVKPQVQPKPDSLHGRALHQSRVSVNSVGNSHDLSERFAKLRGAAAPIKTGSISSSQDSSVKMPSPSEYQSSMRPMGPRSMPSQTPGHPPKLPLDTQLAASLPKEPSPTYSPARNLSLPASIAPPRSSARSIVGTGGRSNSLAASSISAYAPSNNADSDSYFPPQQDTQRKPAPRRFSVSKPAELQISVEKLYDYLRLYRVLAIDVRSRDEFDSGHIFVTSSMCIEPMALRDGLSAEQLQDSLVISPDDEQQMFERRNEYDLVVYYDESTRTNAFLEKHNLNSKEIALKRLYETLHEFNTEKPLQRPPIFLMGGIDAYADLLGPAALKMTTTASAVSNGRSRASQLIRRAPAASESAKLNLRKRRMREYAPMDPEEEQQWLEEARKGRAVLERTNEEDDEDEATSPMYRTTEEFLRHFPEVDQQSMMYPPSRPPPAVPAPPLAPYVAPSIPSVPSRPAPSVPRVSYSGVHERQVAPQGRTQELPVYVSPGRYAQFRPHKTGLVNFGVTCYMNSVVQCLAGNMELSALFLSGRWHKELQKENWKGTKGILPEAYATLLSNLFQGDVTAVRPVSFRKICGHFNSQWTIDQQQDAKEYLEFVLDHLHEDMNRTWNRTPLKQLSEAQEMMREKLPRPYAAIMEWGRYTHREMSLIGGIFAGQHASQLQCTTCGVTSTTYEAFWSISVEIPLDGTADIRDCLRSYCSPERLEKDDFWRCPRCKRDREAVKKITITRAPDSLVVHFKRFNASHTQRAHKVRTPINFPLQGLDLGPYVEPPLSPDQEAQLIEVQRDANLQLTAMKTDPAMNGPFKYNAYAVIHHIGGTLGSGHYIAHVKDRSRGIWRRFNDDKVTEFEPSNLRGVEQLQSDRAYIVFYERERVAGGAFG